MPFRFDLARTLNHCLYLFDLELDKIDVVLFDTTSVVYYGDADKNEELLDFGFSKARRSDLKQVVVGVLMSKEGIPIGLTIKNQSVLMRTELKEGALLSFKALQMRPPNRIISSSNIQENVALRH